MGLYLDKTGLGRLWAKCKSTFAAKSPSKNFGRTSASADVDWYKQILSITQSATWKYFYTKLYVEDAESQKCYAEFVISGRTSNTIDNVSLKIEKLAGYGTCELLAKHNATTHTTEIYLKVHGTYVSPYITLENASTNISIYNSGSWTQSMYSPTWTSARNGLLDSIYPVGSIYMSVNSTSPSTFLGGTWVQLQNRFLLGAGSAYSNGATGGSNKHKHNYKVRYSAYYNGLATIDGDDNCIKAATYDVSNNISWGGKTKVGSSSAGVNNGITEGSRQTSADVYEVTGTTDNVNNMPPYLVVYMWKRTA